MSEVIVITSGKGGVGKTTTAANIGIGLAQLGKKVVMVDTDIGLRNLDVVLGLENRIVYNLVDVVEGNCRMKQALIRDKRYEQLYLLPSAQTRDKTSVTPEQMKKLCEELKQSFDFILLDCPAGIEQGFANAVAGCNHAGGLGDPGCGPHYRPSGGTGSAGYRPYHQPHPAGYGKARRNDVGGRCAGNSCRSTAWNSARR